ncbi:MAG: hypothetical protein WCL06_01175 [Bacteroidota bacterium]
MKVAIIFTAMLGLSLFLAGCGVDCTSTPQNYAYNDGYNSGKNHEDRLDAQHNWTVYRNANNQSDVSSCRYEWDKGYDDGAAGKKCKCEGIEPTHNSFDHGN